MLSKQEKNKRSLAREVKKYWTKVWDCPKCKVPTYVAKGSVMVDSAMFDYVVARRWTEMSKAEKAKAAKPVLKRHRLRKSLQFKKDTISVLDLFVNTSLSRKAS